MGGQNEHDEVKEAGYLSTRKNTTKTSTPICDIPKCLNNGGNCVDFFVFLLPSGTCFLVVTRILLLYSYSKCVSCFRGKMQAIYYHVVRRDLYVDIVTKIVVLLT